MAATRYAQSGDVNVAYQVVGEGPRDLVYVPVWISNIEVMWEEPSMAEFLRRLVSFSRLILFAERRTALGADYKRRTDKLEAAARLAREAPPA